MGHPLHELEQRVELVGELAADLFQLAGCGDARNERDDALCVVDGLRALDVLGSGEGVPTLGAVIDATPDDVLLNVELKERGLAADALALVAEHAGELIVSSFLPPALAAAREVAPDVPRALLFSDAPTENRKTARELNCAALHPRHDLCSEQFVTAAQASGFAVNAWTIRDARTASRLQRVGVDRLIADDPAVCATRSPQVNDGRDTDANNGI